MKKISLLTALLALLIPLAYGACGGGGGGGGGTNVDLTSLAGDWYGPVRLDPCDGDVPLPGVTDERIWTTAMASFNSNGELTEILLNGESFSDPSNTWYAEPSIQYDRLVKLEFPNAPDVMAGYETSVMTRVIEGGGLVLDDPVTPTHAFFYIHDKYGCDLAMGVMELGATSLPAYEYSDFDVHAAVSESSTIWIGKTLEFVDFTGSNGVPLDLRMQGQPNWELIFDFPGETFMMPNITGTLEDNGSPLSITSGEFLPFDPATGYFMMALQADDGSEEWTFRGFLSPDKTFFAGFAWYSPWEMRWHDFTLSRQP